MISLGDNVLINLENWNEAVGIGNASRFTKLITRAVYTPKELSVRSITGDPTCKNPNGLNSRKQFTPRKHMAIRSKSRLYYFLLLCYKSTTKLTFFK